MKTYKNHPLGRSMIEMLAVLAVISILSAGGIWGYNQAMDKLNFNRFVKYVQTMVGATVAAFPKPLSASNSTDSWYSGKTLYRLGILPQDLYKTLSGVSVKNPLTGKNDLSVSVASFSFTGVSFDTSLGKWAFGPAKTLTMLYLSLDKVPKKACAKILAFDWRGLAPDGYGFIVPAYDSSFLFVSPIKTSAAEKVCERDFQNMEMWFFIHGFGFIPKG